MSPVAGDKLGQYEIISLIGKGGMGEADKARDWMIIIVRSLWRP
jgi:hypothetical protein